jgi:hypothetical protein
VQTWQAADATVNVKEQPKQTPRHSREGGNPEDVQAITNVLCQPPLDSRLRGNDAGFSSFGVSLLLHVSWGEGTETHHFETHPTC